MDPYQDAAELLARSKMAVGFTGAGISAESGIDTFRDPGGVWDRFDMSEVGTADGLLNTITRHPEKVLGFIKSTVETFESALPHAGHLALRDLEQMGILKCVITQNIDDLHSQAGNTDVIELHGNLYRARCISCDKKEKLERDGVLGRARQVIEQEDFNPLKLAGVFPKCSCGGLTRPDVVMFGEAVQGMERAYHISDACDLMIILGTSGVVYPAAVLPHEARKSGTKIIEINPTENSFSEITDVFIQAKAGEGLPEVVSRVRKIVGK